MSHSLDVVFFCLSTFVADFLLSFSFSFILQGESELRAAGSEDAASGAGRHSDHQHRRPPECLVDWLVLCIARCGDVALWNYFYFCRCKYYKDLSILIKSHKWRDYFLTFFKKTLVTNVKN